MGARRVTPLEFPRVAPLELALQQQLSRRRHTFTINENHVVLGVAQPPDDLDGLLSIHWQGVPLRLLCHRALLVRWLKPHLQEADFDSLPPTLQLALLEREMQMLPGLVCKSLQPHLPSSLSVSLGITLSRGDDRLILWLSGDAIALLKQLPKRPLEDLFAIPLRLSFQWGPLLISQTELRHLAIGDLLLLPENARTSPVLRGFVEGHVWAQFHQHDNQLELISMHIDDLSEPVNNLSSLDQLPVQVSFEVGRQALDLHTLATLQPGSLIDLATPLTGEVRIMANQRCVGIGELVNLQERLGIRVLRLLLDTPS
jgi:type III secretion protein Q